MAKKSKDSKSSPLKKKIDRFLNNNPQKERTIKSITKRINYQGRSSTISRILHELVEEGRARQVTRTKYTGIASRSISPKAGRQQVHSGRVDMTRSGSAYILVDGLAHDIFVSSKNLNGALDNDLVEVEITRYRQSGQPQGQVTKVIDRHIKDVVARVHSIQHLAYCEPLQDQGIYEIAVHPSHLGQAGEGDIVLIHLTEWPTKRHQAPMGIVTKVLTDYPLHELSELSILTKYGFNTLFPEEIDSELKRIEQQGVQYNAEDRLDYREMTTITIDPADARDFDDALSVVALDASQYEVGVHIADVTHYLTKDSLLDKEARRRSTSVYLVGRVCPMLPEALSNDLCSLVEGEDRLTFSVLFTVSPQFDVLSYKIAKTVIRSNRRFAYEEAQSVLDAGEGDFFEELTLLKRFADRLRAKREKNGAINFESQEIRFLLDEKNHPKDIYIKERKPVHLLVEDLMLLANQTIAEAVDKQTHGRWPLPYRVHDEPDLEKVTDLMYMSRMLGFDFDMSNMRAIRQSFNSLHQAAEKNDTFRILQQIGIRTMAKAIYTTDNIGHFGLAFSHYVHFTSPIRRYADVIAHRMVFAMISGQQPPYKKNEMEALCIYISRQERLAMEAERESIKLKQCEYLKPYENQVFEGEVSGLIDRGFFVSLLNGLGEGLVTFDQLEESFELHPTGFSAKGLQSGRIIAMGDKVSVRIVHVDIEERKIDMSLEP